VSNAAALRVLLLFEVKLHAATDHNLQVPVWHVVPDSEVGWCASYRDLGEALRQDCPICWGVFRRVWVPHFLFRLAAALCVSFLSWSVTPDSIEPNTRQKAGQSTFQASTISFLS
jgi:hypothetical protein